jgi:outer membrane lipoprotein SlyB
VSFKDRARGIFGGAVAQRLGGERPGPLRAAAGGAVAGGVTGVVVYRLLRRGEEQG